MNRERLPRGLAKSRRTRIAEVRRTLIPDIAKRLEQTYFDKERLEVITMQLSAEQPVKLPEPVEGQTRAELEVERAWLQLKLGIITQAEQQSVLSEKFNEWEQRLPDVYHALTAPNREGISRAQEIRNKVMPPPPKIAGFYTKR